MSKTISLDEAQANLKDIVHQLAPGEEITITENQQPVATLSGIRSKPRKPRVSGNCKEMISSLVEDDEHLEDFKEYLQ